MAIADEISDGLSEIEAEFPASFVWNSSTYTAVASAESRAVLAGEYGTESVDSLTLVVQTAQFGDGAQPAERQQINFNSRNYRIETIERAPQAAFKVYRCVRNR